MRPRTRYRLRQRQTASDISRKARRLPGFFFVRGSRLSPGSLKAFEDRDRDGAIRAGRETPGELIAFKFEGTGARGVVPVWK